MEQRIDRAIEIIEAHRGRSAWDRGVRGYALDLLGNLADLWDGKDETLDRAMLNGAQDWHEYSWGGCSLIYDRDIAQALCSPSELKRCKGGALPPNSREEWLDTQARALYQASLLVKDALSRR